MAASQEVRTRKRKCGRERTPGRRRRHRGRGETRRAFRTLESGNDGCGRAGEGQDAGLAAPSARGRRRRSARGEALRPRLSSGVQIRS